MMADDEMGAGQVASPPCFLHEVDPSYSGLSATPPPLSGRELADWRKQERARLIARRSALSTHVRAANSRRICETLNAVVGSPAGRIISAYWPFRGEPDLRPWLDAVRRRGAVTALPVVVAKGAPLVFRQFSAGDRLVRGVWNIPIPADGEEVIPDIVIAPVVGFDSACYRLGYGGGFFDRTLAALPKPALAIGVGYDHASLATIHPQRYDVPMRMVITELGVVSR